MKRGDGMRREMGREGEGEERYGGGEGRERERWRGEGDWGAARALTVNVWQKVRLCPMVVGCRRMDHYALDCLAAVCVGGRGREG